VFGHGFVKLETDYAFTVLAFVLFAPFLVGLSAFDEPSASLTLETLTG
jgi:hypothetical protein